MDNHLDKKKGKLRVGLLMLGTINHDFPIRYTYEVAPVFTLIEQEVIKKSLELVGYPSPPQADGIMNPGGSLSNMYGMMLARYRALPALVKTKGTSGMPPLICFSSEDSHYSIVKGAHWLGLGTDNVYKVQPLFIALMRMQSVSSCIDNSRFLRIISSAHLRRTSQACARDPIPVSITTATDF
jgi:hypothetical protein